MLVKGENSKIVITFGEIEQDVLFRLLAPVRNITKFLL